MALCEMRVEEHFYSPFISFHKLIQMFLFYIVYYRYTDDVDRNYVVYTEKENRGQIIFNLSITFQAIYHQLGNIKNVIYGWIIVLS